MVTVLWFFTADIALWQQWSLIERSLQLMLVCCGGFACYVAVLWLGGIRLSHLKGN
jgi:hypothetical protein